MREGLPDLRHARINVGVLGDQAAREKSLAGLRQAAGFVRRELGTAYVRLSEIQSSMGETGEALTLAKKGLALQKETIDVSADGPRVRLLRDSPGLSRRPSQEATHA